jgi:hypothetical protein
MANSQSNQPPVLGEEVVLRVQGSRWFITKRQWPARLVTCLVGVPEEDNGRCGPDRRPRVTPPQPDVAL